MSYKSNFSISYGSIHSLIFGILYAPGFVFSVVYFSNLIYFLIYNPVFKLISFPEKMMQMMKEVKLGSSSKEVRHDIPFRMKLLSIQIAETLTNLMSPPPKLWLQTIF